MTVNSLEIQNFRNIRDTKIYFDPRYNLITGENAQGKTNLLEAIWLFTGCRSFRGSRERDFIRFGSDRLEMKLDFCDSRREQSANIIMMKNANSIRRKVTLNKVNIASPKELFESFCCVVFTPDDVSLVKDSPDKRRNFIDLCVSQLNPLMMGPVRKSSQLLMQRSAVLKNIAAGISNVSALEIWDVQLAKTGAWLSFLRHQYIERLQQVCAELYSEITGGSEKLEIIYSSGIYPDNYEFPEKNPDEKMAEFYLDALHKNIEGDVAAVRTRYGVSHDDVVILIDGKKVREFGSQGQIKSTALCLRLAQAEIYREKSGEKPVILLDDVMGELDESRQRFVYELIRDMQIFITTCHMESIKYNVDGKIFKVAGGEIAQ